MLYVWVTVQDARPDPPLYRRLDIVHARHVRLLVKSKGNNAGLLGTNMYDLLSFQFYAFRLGARWGHGNVVTRQGEATLKYKVVSGVAARWAKKGRLELFFSYLKKKNHSSL